MSVHGGRCSWQHDPMQNRFGRHKLVQTHEASGRTNLYIAAHAHHIEGKPVDEGQAILTDLLKFAGQERFVFNVAWENPGDLGEY